MKENATGRVPVAGEGRRGIEEEGERVGLIAVKRSLEKKDGKEESREKERERARVHLYLVSPVKRIRITKPTAIHAGKNAHHWRQKDSVTRALTYRNLQRSVFALVNRNLPRLSLQCYVWILRK